MMNNIINRYKRLRNRSELAHGFETQFAFVGAGQHSRQNLYPVIDYLHLPLKWICVRDRRNAELIKRNWRIDAVADLDKILSDKDVKGIFVSIAPHGHFAMARRVLESGKHLFIEKPPCQTLEELTELNNLAKRKGCHVVVGMQHRYAPAVQRLKKELGKHQPTNYHLRYAVGLYPEGNPLLDLFIHQLDLVCYLFGAAKVSFKKICGEKTILLALEHGNVCGLLELSTAYSWTNPQEELYVNTNNGEYRLLSGERLTFMPHPKSFMGIPLEKVKPTTTSIAYLIHNNPNIPILTNNQLYAQGFYGEIATFANLVSKGTGKSLTTLDSLVGTYKLLADVLINND